MGALQLYGNGCGDQTLLLLFLSLRRTSWAPPSTMDVELTSAELSMLLEGITPLRVERRYRLGESLQQMA